MNEAFAKTISELLPDAEFAKLTCHRARPILIRRRTSRTGMQDLANLPITDNFARAIGRELPHANNPFRVQRRDDQPQMRITHIAQFRFRWLVQLFRNEVAAALSQE